MDQFGNSWTNFPIGSEEIPWAHKFLVRANGCHHKTSDSNRHLAANLSSAQRERTFSDFVFFFKRSGHSEGVVCGAVELTLYCATWFCYSVKHYRYKWDGQQQRLSVTHNKLYKQQPLKWATLSERVTIYCICFGQVYLIKCQIKTPSSSSYSRYAPNTHNQTTWKNTIDWLIDWEHLKLFNVLLLIKPHVFMPVYWLNQKLICGLNHLKPFILITV